MEKSSIHNCRVCGYYMPDPPWGEDGQIPTYEMCFCCGVEFGYQDYTVESAIQFRKNWIEDGAKWDECCEKPNNWNLEEQMKYIPEEFK